MLIDSGSVITVVSRHLCQSIKLAYQPVTSPPNVIGANGKTINLIGRIDQACIETKDGYLLDTVWVAEGLNSDAIMGTTSLSAFKALTIRYGGALPTLHVQEITTKSAGFVDHAPVSCFPIKPSLPLRAPSRRQSQEDRHYIKGEIQWLLGEGKIQPSNSPWRSQVFVVRDGGRRPRMVVDYAQMVNRVTPLDAYPIPLVADLLDQVSQYNFFLYRFKVSLPSICITSRRVQVYCL